jgi:hypothetical protein
MQICVGDTNFSEPKSGISPIFLMEEKQLGASLRQFEQRKWQLPKMNEKRGAIPWLLDMGSSL